MVAQISLLSFFTCSLFLCKSSHSIIKFSTLLKLPSLTRLFSPQSFSVSLLFITSPLIFKIHIFTLISTHFCVHYRKTLIKEKYEKEGGEL